MPTERHSRQALQRVYPGLPLLPRSEVGELLRGAGRRILPKGASVFTENTPCVGFPLVIRGSIRIFKASPEGRELPLYRVGPGESCIISTVCLLGRLDYDARAEVEEETEVAILSPSRFEELLSEPAFRQFVFGLFSRRIADLMMLVDALAFKRLDQRLALILAKGAQPRRCTHQQIADELGTVREIASRVLKEFEREGLIRLGRGRIDILDAPGLLARSR